MNKPEKQSRTGGTPFELPRFQPTARSGLSSISHNILRQRGEKRDEMLDMGREYTRVPEPSTGLLTLAGLTWLGLRGRLRIPVRA